MGERRTEADWSPFFGRFRSSGPLTAENSHPRQLLANLVDLNDRFPGISVSLNYDCVCAFS